MMPWHLNQDVQRSVWHSRVSSVLNGKLQRWTVNCVLALQCSPSAFLPQHRGTWGFPWGLFLRHGAPVDNCAPINATCQPRKVTIWNFKMPDRKSNWSTSHEGLKRSLQSSSQKLSRGHSWVWRQKHQVSLNAERTFIPLIEKSETLRKRGGIVSWILTSSKREELHGTLSITTLCSLAGWSITTLVVFRRFSSGSPSKLSLL